MPAFIYSKVPGGAARYLSNPAPTMDPAGFDTVSARVFFRGNMAALLAKYPIGATAGATGLTGLPSGSQVYCLGPQGQPEVSFGHIEADIAWKGIISTRTLSGEFVDTLSTGDQVLGVSLGMTTNETNWPQERDGVTIYAGAPYSPAPGYRTKAVIGPGGTLIPTAYLPYRVRIIGRSYTASVRGITIGDRTAVKFPPRCRIIDPFKTDPYQDVDNRPDIPDPLYTYSSETGQADGWVCRNYQRNGGEYPMGEKVLAYWTAEYEFVRRKSL